MVCGGEIAVVAKTWLQVGTVLCTGTQICLLYGIVYPLQTTHVSRLRGVCVLYVLYYTAPYPQHILLPRMYRVCTVHINPIYRHGHSQTSLQSLV